MPFNSFYSHNEYVWSNSKDLGLVYCNQCQCCTPVHSALNHIKRHLGKTVDIKPIEEVLKKEYRDTPWDGFEPNLDETKSRLLVFFQENNKLPLLNIEPGYYLCIHDGCVQCFKALKSLSKHLKETHLGWLD